MGVAEVLEERSPGRLAQVLASPFDRHGTVWAPDGGAIPQLSDMGCTLGMALLRISRDSGGWAKCALGAVMAHQLLCQPVS